MTKIMLVEDDKSLREIYGVRLLAEGYDIVSAGDGEEALAVAIKERPQLIVSDVMMPKISGFDMLDILRSTTETKNIKVIMMTALSSEEQRMRGESLGADRYLVKSQVGIEDVVHVVHEVLGDQVAAEPALVASAPTQPQSSPASPAAPALKTPVQSSVAPAPATATSQPVPPTQPQAASAPMASSPAPTVVNEPVTAAPLPPSSAPKPPSQRSRVIQPLNDPNQATINLNDLLSKELAKEVGVDSENSPTVASVKQEQADIDQQLAEFIPSAPVIKTETAEPAESVTPVPTTPATPSETPTDTPIDTQAKPITTPSTPNVAPTAPVTTPVTTPAVTPVVTPVATSIPVVDAPVLQQPVVPAAAPTVLNATPVASQQPTTMPTPMIPTAAPPVSNNQSDVPSISIGPDGAVKSNSTQ